MFHQRGSCLQSAVIAGAIFLALGVYFSITRPAPPVPAATEVAAIVPSATPTARPTATPEPTATSTPVPYASGGLGLSASELTARFGPRRPDVAPGFWRYGLYIVALLDDRAWYIERQYHAPVTVAEAQAEWQGLLPADATLVRTYQPEGRPETHVGLFFSPTLAGQLPSAAWPGGEPGNFTVHFNQYAQGVERMIIATGNNP